MDLNFNRIGESVIANIITVGILIGVATIISVEVKRELFFNGTSKTNYTLLLN
jgi:hypothetical protein